MITKAWSGEINKIDLYMFPFTHEQIWRIINCKPMQSLCNFFFFFSFEQKEKLIRKEGILTLLWLLDLAEKCFPKASAISMHQQVRNMTLLIDYYLVLDDSYTAYNLKRKRRQTNRILFHKMCILLVTKGYPWSQLHKKERRRGTRREDLLHICKPESRTTNKSWRID